MCKEVRRKVIVTLDREEPYSGEFHRWVRFDRDIFAIIETKGGLINLVYYKCVQFTGN